jgi:cytoskeletal protein RodZ
MESIGAHLRKERELRQVSLEELVQTTRIPLATLQSIEEDRFDDLPGEVFVRGFLRSYATAVGLDAEATVARYHGERTVEDSTPAPLNTLMPPDRGRRFGVGVAVAILVILFALVLSIVLRPRHRDRPLELSSVVPSTLQIPGACDLRDTRLS